MQVLMLGLDFLYRRLKPHHKNITKVIGEIEVQAGRKGRPPHGSSRGNGSPADNAGQQGEENATGANGKAAAGKGQ